MDEAFRDERSYAVVHGDIVARTERCDSVPDRFEARCPADSFRKVDATTGKSRPVDRETLRAVQTPQVFRADLLRRAYKADYRPEFTDDASVVEANGEQVTLCEGERTNIKITSPADLLIARILRHAGDGKETDSL